MQLLWLLVPYKHLDMSRISLPSALLLSYDSHDRNWVYRLKDELEREDVIVELAEMKDQDLIIPKILELSEQIETGINLKYLGLVISRTSINSTWLEWLNQKSSQGAFKVEQKEIAGEKVWIHSVKKDEAVIKEIVLLPIIIGDIENVPNLRRIKFLDFRDNFNYPSNIDYIIEIVNKPKQFPIVTDSKSSNSYLFDLYTVPRDRLLELHQIGSAFFSSEDWVLLRQLEIWHEQDPNSFRVMKNKNEEIVAFFIILAGETLHQNIINIDAERSIFIEALAQKDINRRDISAYVILYLAKYLDLLKEIVHFKRIYTSPRTDAYSTLLKRLDFKFKLDSKVNGRDVFLLEIDQKMSLFEYVQRKVHDLFKIYAKVVKLDDDAKPLIGADKF